MARPFSLCALLLSLVLPAFAPPAMAQQDGEQAARRQRLQLQRAQAELEEAAAQRDALQSAKSSAEAAARKLQAQSRSMAQSVASMRADIAQQQIVIDRLQAALLAQADGAERQRQAAEASDARLREELAAARREAADRLQTTRSLAALLERSTAALNQAETRNGALHREALVAVEQYRQEAGRAEISVLDPLGLRAVKRENNLDRLREGLGKHVPPR